MTKPAFTHKVRHSLTTSLYDIPLQYFLVEFRIHGPSVIGSFPVQAPNNHTTTTIDFWLFFYKMLCEFCTRCNGICPKIILSQLSTESLSITKMFFWQM